MTATQFGGYVAAQVIVPSGVVVTATTNAGGPTAVNVTAGTYETVFTFVTQLIADLNSQRPVTAGLWAGSVSAGAAGSTGLFTLSVNAGTYSVTWTSTALRDLLGFAANITTQSSATGTLNVRGVCLLDCPIAMDGRYTSAPRETDTRQTEGPTGEITTHTGNVKRVHENVSWSLVPMHKVWADDELTTYESLESFFVDTQWEAGHAWFTAGSAVEIMAHDAEIIGGTSFNQWKWKDVTRVPAKRVSEWDGLWAVLISRMVAA